jgi:hypothetical protein
MGWRTAAAASALALGVVTSTWAQTTITVQDQRGTVSRVDPQANVIVLEDGRMFRITPHTTVFVNNQPITSGTVTLSPGVPIVIRSGEMVTIQDGRYVVATTAPAAPQPGTTFVTVPVARQIVPGRVRDVDKDGEVTIETPGGEFEVRFSPDAARTMKKGDAVQLDITVLPPGAMPSALPRP